MEQINWGIIGCGDVTEVKSGPAFNKVPNSKLVAVMRRNAAKAADYAKRHGVPKWYTDATALINDPEINAIYIATPPGSHEEYTLLSIKAGKPVYVEKPMTLDASSAKRMADAAIAHDIKLVVAHYRRAQPMFLKIKSLLEEKIIGEVNLIQMKMLQAQTNDLIANTEENWRLNPEISGGGLFHDLAPHQLDLMYFYFGAISKANGIAVQQYGTNGAHDLVTGTILFKSGVVFNGTWCFTVPNDEKADCCEIYGSVGKISFPIFGNTLTIALAGKITEHIFEPLAHVQQPMIEKVVDYFLDRGPNPCSATEAEITMKLLDDFTGKTSK
jgi:predicted dehydrogenase